MDWMFDYNIWLSFLTLSGLEIVLGIDNVVFLALVVAHLPPRQRKQARMIGLIGALGMRVALLFAAAWLMGMNATWLSVLGREFSGKDILMLCGGLFLIYKATMGIHEEFTGEEKKEIKSRKGGFAMTIAQVMVIDMIFSFDSIMAAVGLTQNIPVIIAAMVVAIIIMLVSAGVVSDFIAKHPTLKMLAYAFILLIGFFLLMEGFRYEFPKGYIYFGMAFSLTVEALNLMAKAKRSKKETR